MEITVIISALCTALGATLGIAGYKRTLTKDASVDGKSKGIILTEIGYIKSGVDDIKSEQRDQREKQGKLAERVAKVEASAASAHHRLDGIGRKENA